MDPEVIIPVLAIVLGSLIVLIPLAGLTLRFAVKPAMDAYFRVKASAAPGGDELRVVEQRVTLLEQQMRLLASGVPVAEVVRPSEAGQLPPTA
ncbi:MAG TPA: hypothetical protein VFI96_00030 [Longimicrobiaceae bacterium]|nr:hypothetical protein [Longimicrobiaceae bacterium]